jgi:hypothetical protein
MIPFDRLTTANPLQYALEAAIGTRSDQFRLDSLRTLFLSLDELLVGNSWHEDLLLFLGEVVFPS